MRRHLIGSEKKVQNEWKLLFAALAAIDLWITKPLP